MKRRARTVRVYKPPIIRRTGGAYKGVSKYISIKHKPQIYWLKINVEGRN
jgi:hypothetical protein